MSRVHVVTREVQTVDVLIAPSTDIDVTHEIDYDMRPHPVRFVHVAFTLQGGDVLRVAIPADRAADLACLVKSHALDAKTEFEREMRA